MPSPSLVPGFQRRTCPLLKQCGWYPVWWDWKADATGEVLSFCLLETGELIPTFILFLSYLWLTLVRSRWCCRFLKQASKKYYLPFFMPDSGFKHQILPLFLSLSSLLFGITLNVWISKSLVYLAINSPVILITSISGFDLGLNLLSRRHLVRDQFLMGLAK